MSDPNASISNGTCYYKADEESPGNMLPCGNAALGHKHCCQAGDMCLEGGVCFNDELEITYMAGCTDPEYENEDDGCWELRQYDSSPWLRVVLCEDGQSTYAAQCGRDSVAPETVESYDCACPSSFTDHNLNYPREVQLPTSLGDSVIWQPGHSPTSSDKSSSTASETSDIATVTVIIGGGGDSSGDKSGDLSVGAKAGIGVGVSLAGLIIVAMVFLLLRRRGRGAAMDTKRAGPGGTLSLFFSKMRGGTTTEGVEKAGPGGRGPLPTELPVKAGTPPPSELPDNATRSELDETGSNRASAGTWNVVSEVSAATGNRGSGLRSEYEGGANGCEQRGNMVSELP